jgi:hypothetical protein
MLDHTHLMHGLTVQHLRFQVQALEPISFSDQPGSSLRGALYAVLADNFCSEPFQHVTPDHQSRCPVCWLLAAEADDARRGRDLPRPLTVEPPLPRTEFGAGSRFAFGFTLIGNAQNLFPYLARAVQKMGAIGVGRGRKRFKLTQITEYNPCLDVERVLMNNNHVVKQPTLQITPSRLAETAAQLPPERVTLEFLTPLRLTADQKLVKRPDPLAFCQRLLERCQSLAEHYAETDSRPSLQVWQSTAQTLSTHAQSIRVAYDDTQWVEARSGSRRQQRYTPISGLVGTVRWEGDLQPLLPWILWGSSLHVGKNAVKGNGWYIVKR